MVREHDELLRACKYKEYINITSRAIGVKMVLVDKCTVVHAAKSIEMSREMLSKWIKRYEQDGIAGLEDRPGRGRPRLVSNKMVSYLASLEKYKDVRFVQQKIINRTGVKYHPKTIQRRLVETGHTVKRYIYQVQANRESDEGIKKYQEDNLPWIIRADKRGHLVMVEDEMHMGTHSRRRGPVWSLKGIKTYMKAPSKGEKISIFAAVGIRGQKHIDTFSKANTDAFIKFLKGLVKKYGKRYKRIIIIMDNASYHKSKKLLEYIETTNIIPVYLPTSVPELNAIEELWHQFKSKMPADLYFEVVEDMIKYVEENLKNKPIKLDVLKFLKREITTPI